MDTRSGRGFGSRGLHRARDRGRQTQTCECEGRFSRPKKRALAPEPGRRLGYGAPDVGAAGRLCRLPDSGRQVHDGTFGPKHTFRINALPYRMVDGEHRFQSNNYWMTVVDPWPDTDDVDVLYDNGYYLYNTRYPDTGLSLRFAKP